LLVVLVPLVAVLFVLSANTQDMLSNRYLLTWLSALPVLTGGLLARWTRRGPLAVAAVFALLLAPGISALLGWRASGTLDARWRLVRHPEPLVDLVTDLEQRGIRNAYAPYWTAYKATFLAHERVVVTPINGWDRYPPYTARVDAAPREAYLFAVDPPNVSPQDSAAANAERARFEAKLEAAGLAVERRDFGFYRVYSAAAAGRLLPPPIRRPVAALAKPAALLRPIDPPTSLPAGGSVRIRVEITNRSDGFWSADGIAKLAGSDRVAASYRWLDAEGRTALVVDGARTPLPQDLDVGDSAELAVRVDVPATPGRYVLRLTLVQENVAWFDQATGSQASLQVDVQ
jgi:hypothetical protein